ncbi:CC0125/CC1285 family lipoprotein [Aliiglaciecola litoralis]|uniref:Lipoprotein n=1 Tax=Aliiglaciecola litoralis TaxID=582857 RepID=A0ABP3X2U7_9ALTE
MKYIMVFLSIVLLISGCASAPDYRPAKNGSEGYSEQKVSSDRYRVQFKLYSKSVADAFDYALLRSAELTQQQGYDWFVVTSKETFVESQKVQPASSIGVSQQRQVERHCGLLTCDTRTRPSTEVGVSINSSAGNERKEVHTILEIRMGKGTKTNDDAYGAQDVLDSLSSKLDKQ